MSKLIKTALIAGLIVLPLSAHAAGKMNKIDTSGDGVVTFTEFSSHADARFAASDTDGNGFVTQDERKSAMKAHMAERAAKKFAAADANGDGALTQAEIQARMDAKMAEKSAKRGERSGERKARKGDGERSGKKGMRGERPNPDTDGDGQISQAEHAAMVQSQFNKLDANSDGVLSADEMPKKRGKRGGKRSRRGGK